jgi:hypothetical protein
VAMLDAKWHRTAGGRGRVMLLKYSKVLFCEVSHCSFLVSQTLVTSDPCPVFLSFIQQGPWCHQYTMATSHIIMGHTCACDIVFCMHACYDRTKPFASRFLA